MKQIMNIITGKSWATSDFTQLNDYEVFLHNSFTEDLSTSNYSSARQRIINHIVDEKNASQDLINKVAELRNQNFQANAFDVPEHSVALATYQQEKTIAAPAQDLCAYLRPIVDEMSNETFNSLIEVTNQLPELVYFAFQPAFILSLGIKTFMLSIPILMHAGNFAKLLVYCKNYKNGISSRLFYGKMLSLAKPYLLRGSLAAGILITIPLAIYGLTGYKSTTVKTNTPFTKTPVLTSNSFRKGGVISQAVDKLASLLRQAGSEFAVLTGSLFQGYINEMFYTAIATADSSSKASSLDNPELNNTSKMGDAK